jgi:hypothetical protein
MNLRMAQLASRGRLIAVGGHSRHVGKSSLITQLLPLLGGKEWMAVKISGHRHGLDRAGDSVIEEHDREGFSATARFLRAGARRAFLLRATDGEMHAAAAWIEGHLSRGTNVIVESNRIVDSLACDLVFFVAAPAIEDWKTSSAGCLAFADAVVFSGPGCLPPHARACCPDSIETFSIRHGEAAPEDLAEWVRGGIPCPRPATVVAG